MIAHEHILKIPLKDFFIVLIFSVIFSAFMYVGHYLFTPAYSFLISLGLLVFGFNSLVYLTNKSGIAAIFSALTALFTFNLGDLGIIGGQRIIVFILSALVFEFFFLFLKLHIHNVPLDIVLGTSFSLASLPLFIAFFLSPTLASSFPVALINLILSAFAVGLLASSIVFLIWHEVEKTRVILKIKFYLLV